jgi:hypothetical protein
MRSTHRRQGTLPLRGDRGLLFDIGRLRVRSARPARHSGHGDGASPASGKVEPVVLGEGLGYLPSAAASTSYSAAIIRSTCFASNNPSGPVGAMSVNGDS